MVFALLAVHAGLSLSAGNTALVITINGAINPVTAEYIIQSIDSADSDPSVELLVIEMDTPGGLDTSMRSIIKKMQGASKPVVVFVSPSGSRAASAGAFITISAHIAAMAPGTNIGAATPVNMGGGGMDRTMKKKVTNDAAAYIRSLAESYGRDPDMAEKFVRKGDSISETVAKENNVIDLVTDNLETLFVAIDGKKVKTASGEKTLSTTGITIKRAEMNWRQKVFNAIANPNIAYLLMMLGFYGLILELYNPGAIYPGVIGAISIILAFYSLQALPINYAGALMIILAILLFAIEAMVPSFGVLTIGGVVALIIGSIMLIDSPAEYLRISLSVIIPTALATGAFFFFLVGSALQAQRNKVKTGQEGLIGSEGVVESMIGANSVGKVFVTGELWNAVSESGSIEKGAPIVVTSQKGLTLTVKGGAKEA